MIQKIALFILIKVSQIILLISSFLKFKQHLKRINLIQNILIQSKYV